MSILNSEKPTIIKFYSDTCAPCKALTPILNKLQSEYGDKIDFHSINVFFDAPEVVAEAKIKSVPVVIFVKDGQIKHKHHGIGTESYFKTLVNDYLI